MAIRLGDEAPDFTAETTEGPHQLPRMEARQVGGALFASARFHPGLHDRAGRGRKVEERVRQAEHEGDRPERRPARQPHDGPSDIKDVTGAELNFPLIADPDKSVANKYDMIHPNASDTATVRSVFIIGAGQQGEADADLSGEHRPQLRGAAARHRLAAADGEAPGGDARPTGRPARTSSSFRRCRTRMRRSGSRDSWRRSRTCASRRSRRPPAV